MFLRTQEDIMEIFSSKITGKFSIREVSELSGKPYPLVHRSVKDMIGKGSCP